MEKTRRLNSVTAALVVVVASIVVVVGVIAAFYHSASLGSSGSNGTVSTASAQPCSTPIPQDPLSSQPTGSGIYNGHEMPNGSYRWLIFTMKPGAVATFCVTVPLRQGSWNASVLEAKAEVVNVTSQGGCCEYAYSQARGVNITFVPASVDLASLASAAGSVSVTYTMTATKTGFYTLDYPGVCGLIPLAVSDNPQSVSTEDFQGFFQPSTCPLFPPFDGWSQMTGFSGMTASWVTGPQV